MVTEAVSGTLEGLVGYLLSVQGIAAPVGLAALMAQFGIQLTWGDLRRTTVEYNLVARWFQENKSREFRPLAHPKPEQHYGEEDGYRNPES